MTTVYLKAIMEVYGKTISGLALNKNIRPVLLDNLAAMCLACNMFVCIVLISVSPIMISAYKTSTLLNKNY